MPQRKLFAFFLFLVMGLFIPFLNACKGKDPNPNNKTKTDIITKNWKVKKVDATRSGTTTTIYDGNVKTTDYTAYRLNFTSASAFTRTDKDNTITSGTWRFDDSQSKVIFDRGQPSEVTVVELNDNSLIITYSETTSKGVQSDIRMELIPA